MAGSLHDRLRREYARAAADGLDRSLPGVDRPGLRYRIDGRPVVGFCSNDYLAYADSIAPPAASGAGASRLVCGDHDLARAAESTIAQLCDAEDAVLFPSGFQLNVGCLPALVGDDRVTTDRLIHASLIDGLRLARPTPEILPHNQAPADPDPRTWWVTESLFSMDGDGPDIEQMRTHLKAGALLYLDEAHAFGLYDRGQGRAAAHDLRPTVTVVTLGKAAGASGAALVADRVICDHVRTRARSFVYSTGVSPLVCTAITANLRALAGDDGEQRRAQLRKNIHWLREALGLAPDPAPVPSPIIPLRIGASHDALAASQRLLTRGVHVQPIRPPTVPEGTARLRVTVSAGHTPRELAQLVDALRAEHPLADAS
jgi:7-keto-8-aminopelargonate synthetase-like enzyme